jgi:hypothetical protein
VALGGNVRDADLLDLETAFIAYALGAVFAYVKRFHPTIRVIMM